MDFNRFRQMGSAIAGRIKAGISKPAAIDYHAATDQGLKRENNEDCFFTAGPGDPSFDTGRLGCLFVVADGMGGHRAGETASLMACRRLEDFYREPGSTDPQSDPVSDPVLDPGPCLADLIRQADREILEKALSDPELTGMGTTLSALLIRKNQAFIAHVGDSRIYRLRAGMLEQLSLDHTHVQELVDMGRLTRQEARTHHLRHVITHAVGTRKGFKDVFTLTEPVRPGDLYLLCSDGLHDMVGNQEIFTLLSAAGPVTEKCDRLVSTALENGGRDNVTVVLAAVP